jgi:hypothetical protein
MTSPPPLTSDGHNGCGDVMLKVWGTIPDYRGVGPKPKNPVSAEDWKHLKIIKFRAEDPNTKFKKKVVFGNKAEVLAQLGKGTVHVERMHLTQRNWNSRLTRKTISFSKKIEMHQAAGDWANAYFNLCFETSALSIPNYKTKEEMDEVPKFQEKWNHRTPMMAAKLTDKKWTVLELMNTRVLKSNGQLLRG